MGRGRAWEEIGRDLAGPWERREAQKSWQVPNLWWQAGQPLSECPSLSLSGLATRAALTGNATGVQLVGAEKTGSGRGFAHGQLLPRRWALPRPPPPKCGWRGPEPTPLNLSRSLLARAAHPPREPAISPHLEVRLLNLTAGLPGLGGFSARAPHLGPFHIRSNASQGFVCL